MATLTPAFLTVDDPTTAIPGYLTGRTWNGYECPVFDVATLRQYRAELAEMFPAESESMGNWGITAITWDESDMPHIRDYTYSDIPTDLIATVSINGREYVTIGGHEFCWTVAD